MKKKENQLVSLIFNIVIPVLIMTKLSGTEGRFALGPAYSLIIAVSFPLIYGLYHFVQAKKVNFISVLGFASVLLTGVMGLLTFIDPFWFAIKEAAVPAIIAIVVLVSIYYNHNIIQKILFNDEIMDMERVNELLKQNEKVDLFKKTITQASYWVVVSFIVSSILNFTLARVILTAQPGTTEFTEQLGTMNGLSFPVIAVPCTIILVVVMFFVFKKIKEYTGLQLEDIVKK
ncbi:MAG TPA: VC0807 family protein [Bacteroidales bacterium]|jgi:hypothetical protein|nr:VC0807 family protein [Bacteroidales bacterium]